MNVVLDIDNIDDIPDPKTCSFCKAIHHTCIRCLKNSHMCSKCGKILYYCDICKEEFSAISMLKKHENENTFCKKIKEFKDISLESQLRKFKNQKRKSIS